MTDEYGTVLSSFIEEAKLTDFYPSGIADPKIQDIISRAPQAQYSWLQWANAFQVKEGQQGQFTLDLQEFFMGFLKLALYDIYVLVDDSGSMYKEQRIPHLKEQLKTILDVDLLFETNGVQVEFLNKKGGVKIKDRNVVQSEIEKIGFNGPTRLGTELENKILRNIFQSSDNNNLEKPCLVYIITDGEPMGETRDKLGQAIQGCKQKLKSESAVTFGIVQVGSNKNARDFLGELESDDGVNVHVTADLDLQNEFRRSKKRVMVTSQFLAIQTLIGAVDTAVRWNEEKA
jgi:uncharacterized protein YegL